jgi:lipopolysaccharide biosynthesis regulator YciM
MIVMERQEEALTVLLDLLNYVPKEAPVHVVIGKIYKKMGNTDKALQYF